MNNFLLVNLTAAIATAAPVPAAAQAPASVSATFGDYHPAALYDGISTTSFYLPMRDGTRIAMQVSRPAHDGKAVEGHFPVIWEASISLPPVPADKPRDNSATGFVDWSRLVHSGYVIVTVARRGNGQSLGTVRGYHDREEAYDAYEITEWLAKQPWSDGKIGMHGCSNTGEAVMHALTVAPPHLKAAWAGCFSWSKYDGFLRGGGIIANWGAGPQRTIEQDMAQRPVDGDENKTILHQAALDHQRNSNLGELLRSVPFRDSWSPLSRSSFVVEDSAASYMDQIQRAKIPLTIQGGWYDDFRGQAFITFANLPGTRVLIGPWQHCRSNDFDLLSEAQRFFDYHLKGIDTGITREDPIHYFVVGASPEKAWKSAATWPLSDTRAKTYYLSDGRLEDRPRMAAPSRFSVDPAPVCQGAAPPRDANSAAPFIQPCHRTNGTVSFATKPGTKDVTLTGHAIAKLWISANAPDAKVFAYLEDVAPDGKITVITEGRLKASLRKLDTAPWQMIGLPWHRGYASDAKPLVASEAQELTFDLLPAAYTVPAGHRVQVTVSGSDPREQAPSSASVEIALLSDGPHPSSITLPVIP